MTYTKKMRRMFGEAKTHGKEHKTISFRRAHYEFIADSLKNAKPGFSAGPCCNEAWVNVCIKIANRFKALDNGFDAGRFVWACGAV